ncbi:hypothetical protein CIPAW_11G006900 [Carya illinoinensis]|uniref:Uncharacterized protein n=1 Tax=Carya illinoinensis TaxID=32201 RepID=A0A8T1NS30_CARIL|nr:hypothetical protein CIPAW_11G006900 [Carya illinoinensis]
MNYSLFVRIYMPSINIKVPNLTLAVSGSDAISPQ